MFRKPGPSLIAIAVGVLAVALPVSLLLWFYPPSRSVAVDVLVYVGGMVLWGAVMFSRGLRTLAIGVIITPALLVLFFMTPREIGLVLLACALCAWMIFLGPLTRQQGERVVFFLMKVFGVWAAVIALIVLLNPLGAKVSALILFWTLNAAWLIWRVVVGPEGVSGSAPRDPWRWSRDRDGTWRP